MRRLSVLAFVAALAFGQESPVAKPPAATGGETAPAVLEYTGKPMVVPFLCTDQDIQLAGLACSEEAPCPLFLELDAVAASGEHIWVGGNLHTSAVTMYSTLFGSDDGGRTWREAADRVRFAGIDSIQFLDAQTGWASGEKISPLPQDAFLLITTDGGKSWRMRSVFSESADNKLGAIQQFSFAAKDSGSLIIDRGQGSDSDRYELYESPDGGESWSFRQSSRKPLALPRPPAMSTSWRLRADSRTHAYHVEHRQAERWNTIAAFAVPIGACKP